MTKKEVATVVAIKKFAKKGAREFHLVILALHAVAEDVAEHDEGHSAIIMADMAETLKEVSEDFRKDCTGLPLV